jgi:uncharacterized protein
MSDKFWQNKPLDALSEDEWEALCDGCGKCCLHKIIDEDTDILYQTSVACRLLDVEQCQCSNYSNRKQFVSDCIKITPANVEELHWLPDTCAYRLRAANKPLPIWHHLVSGKKDLVHHLFHSARGIAVTEQQAGDDLENHIISVIEV